MYSYAAKNGATLLRERAIRNSRHRHALGERARACVPAAGEVLDRGTRSLQSYLLPHLGAVIHLICEKLAGLEKPLEFDLGVFG